ncbi:MAG: DUF1761 domain-containing protein [Microgenomates group bacterium]
MNINFVTVLWAAILQFIFGAVWYSAFFGKLWGRIHGFDKLTKEVQMKMMKSMGPIYVVQFLITVVTTFVLAIFMAYQPEWNAYAMAGFIWIGFIVPTQISGVLFGGTEPKWIVKKIAIQAFCSLFCLEIAALLLSFR